MQPGAEEEQEFNEAVYGQPLQLQQHLVQPTLPAALVPGQHEPRRQHGHAPSSGPAGQIQPLNPGQEVPPVRAAACILRWLQTTCALVAVCAVRTLYWCSMTLPRLRATVCLPYSCCPAGGAGHAAAPEPRCLPCHGASSTTKRPLTTSIASLYWPWLCTPMLLDP